VVTLDGSADSDVGTFRVLGETIQALQKLIDATAQRLVSRATQKGLVPLEVRKRTSLRLDAVSTGSAILHVSPADKELFDSVTGRIRQLTLAAGDGKRLAAELSDLGPRVRSTYDELLTTLARHKVSVFLEGGASSATLSRYTANQVHGTLVAASHEATEDLEVTGRFVAFDTRGGTFDFIDEDDEQQFKGAVSAQLLSETRSVTVGQGVRYRVWLQLQAMRRVGADQTIEYLLHRVEDASL
jgi:hypothetical protein